VAAADIKQRPPNLTPSSNETMSKARTWLQRCCSTHEACATREFDSDQLVTSDAQTLKPRRLIKIFQRSAGPAITVHPRLCLVDTTYISWPKYATLSYCWGGDQKVKLTMSNLASWQSKISFHNLPQTIKDAIIVTAELGLEYLWIDALCIIQDDDADKGVELARMGDIYSKAHFTLLASRSPTVQDGFLKPRYIPKERGYRLPYICNDGQIGSVVLWAGRDVGVAEPIHQRGWCFQEQILSARILEFGTHQIRYLCTANRTEEVVPETDGWITNSETFAVHGTGRPLDLPANWATLPVDGTEFLTMWNNIVMHYSHLSLSFSTDRLRAISAIARKLKQASSARYYAGLWAEHLPSQLLWETTNDDKLFPKATRAAKPAAPSWSWASMQGPISLRDYEGHAAYRILEISINNSTPGDDFSDVDVVDANISLRTLTLHARVTRHKSPSSPWWPTDLVDNSWSMTVQEDSEQFFPLLLFIDPESGKEWSDISGRWDEFTTGDHAVLLAKITLGKGLILKAKPSSIEKYTRVGTFQLDTYVEDDDRWQQRDISIY
jgi:hypothetical protein